MFSQAKKIMFALLLTAALFAMIAFGPVQAQTQQPPQPEGSPMVRTVSVSGSGMVAVEPDTVVLQIGVQTEAEDASAALDRNNQQMENLLAALRSAGVNNRDIQTQALNLYPRYENPPQPETSGEPQVTGYIASHIVEVRAGQITGLGDLIDAAIEAGGNSIQNIRFENSEVSQTLETARQQAFEDARQKAEQLAELAGASLGQVVAIQENAGQPIPFGMGGAAAFDTASQVPVQSGVNQIQVNLQVTWELQAGTSQ